MKYILSSLLTILLTGVAMSQYDENVSDYRPKYEKPEEVKEEYINPIDTIEFEKDQSQLVDSLVDELAAFYGKANVPANGHRIQVYTGSSEKLAREAEAWIKENYGSDYNVYTTFQLQWRVRVGDFLDPLRAHRLYMALKEQFPNALKVEDVINVKKVK